jgi:hypothetical protein
MKTTIFLDMASCSLVEIHGRFGKTCCLHLQGRRVRCHNCLVLHNFPIEFSKAVAYCSQGHGNSMCHVMKTLETHLNRTEVNTDDPRFMKVRVRKFRSYEYFIINT